MDWSPTSSNKEEGQAICHLVGQSEGESKRERREELLPCAVDSQDTPDQKPAGFLPAWNPARINYIPPMEEIVYTGEETQEETQAKRVAPMREVGAWS